jgi:hypothetical protein
VQINLVLSLIFAVGQIVAGVFVARRVVGGNAWQRPSMPLLLALSCWFVASGACELFVSGMETAHVLGGTPSLATFANWRARADDALLAVSVALVVLLAGSYAALRLRQVTSRR